MADVAEFAHGSLAQISIVPEAFNQKSGTETDVLSNVMVIIQLPTLPDSQRVNNQRGQSRPTRPLQAFAIAFVIWLSLPIDPDPEQ